MLQSLYTLKKMKEKKIYQNNWYTFYWGNRFDISYETCGYFESCPRINICLGFFNFTLKFPFIKNKKWEDECDSPKWGVAIHNNTLWIYKGGKGNMNGGNKWWTWNIPFITKEWVRTSILLKDGSWAHETKGNRNKQFWDEKWKSQQKSWTYDFTDKYDNTIIPTTIYVEEREWRPKGLLWTGLFKDVRRTIDVHFSKEVGSRKGSWKGGTIGCGYDLLPNEEPLDCLKRMERERNFNR